MHDAAQRPSVPFPTRVQLEQTTRLGSLVMHWSVRRSELASSGEGVSQGSKAQSPLTVDLSVVAASWVMHQPATAEEFCGQEVLRGFLGRSSGLRAVLLRAVSALRLPSC